MSRKVRLNRALSLCGVESRRKADALIEAGRVKVNGKQVLDFSFQVDLDCDRLFVDGHELELFSLDYIAFNKPRGILTTCADDRGRRTVLDVLPSELAHLKPVGRLDYDSEGLLILTNDGDLAAALTHPSHEVPKLYRVTVGGTLSDLDLRTLASGVRLSEGVTKQARVRKISANSRSTTFEIELREGRNRQVRRMCAKLGLSVIRLVRVAIGGLQLGHLEAGSWRRLTSHELSVLYPKET